LLGIESLAAAAIGSMLCQSRSHLSDSAGLVRMSMPLVVQAPDVRHCRPTGLPPAVSFCTPRAAPRCTEEVAFILAESTCGSPCRQAGGAHTIPMDAFVALSTATGGRFQPRRSPRAVDAPMSRVWRRLVGEDADDQTHSRTARGRRGATNDRGAALQRYPRVVKM